MGFCTPYACSIFVLFLKFLHEYCLLSASLPCRCERCATILKSDGKKKTMENGSVLQRQNTKGRIPGYSGLSNSCLMAYKHHFPFPAK